MQIKKKSFGYALLNALLGIFLLSGIIYLIMHTMTQYNAEKNATSVGSELAPIVSELLASDLSSVNLNEPHPLVTPSSNSTCQGQALVTNVAPGYLQALSSSGFDLASSACVSITE
jgi:hypothetical protein